MTTMSQKLQTNKMINSINLWFDNFISWIVFLKNHLNEYMAAGNRIPPDKFYSWLAEFLAPGGIAEGLRTNFVFGENNTTIIATRMNGILSYFGTTSALIETLSLQSFVHSFGLGDSFFYAPYFPFIAQFVGIQALAFSVVAVVSVCLFLCTWIILGNILLSVLTIFILLIAVIEMVALQVLLNLGFNVVSILLMASGTGLGIEYIVHVMRTFVQNNRDNQTLEDQVIITLQTIGGPVLLSALSSFVGLSVLLFINNPLVRSYFATMWITLVAISAFHGLLVLPLVLASIPMEHNNFCSFRSQEWVPAQTEITEESKEPAKELELIGDTITSLNEDDDSDDDNNQLM